VFHKSIPHAFRGLYQAEKVEEPSWLFLPSFKRLETSSTFDKYEFSCSIIKRKYTSMKMEKE